MKKIALQLPKQDFYSFKLCMVDKIHAVRRVDNNDDMHFPSQKFNSVNVWVAAKTKNAPTKWTCVVISIAQKVSSDIFLDRPTLQTALALSDLGVIMLNRLSLHV